MVLGAYVSMQNIIENFQKGEDPDDAAWQGYLPDRTFTYILPHQIYFNEIENQ